MARFRPGSTGIRVTCAPVLAALEGTPVDGVLAVGDRPAWLAAHIAQAHGLPWHAPEAVAVATHKLLARGRMLAAGLPVPWFVSLPAHGDDDLDRLTRGALSLRGQAGRVCRPVAA